MNDVQLDRVYDVVSMIPTGKVSTYGIIAKFLNIPNPRWVGRALRLIPSHINHVPAHRVVNAAGKISGEISDPSTSIRIQKLKDEGVIISVNKIVNLKHYFWDPSIEIN